MHANPGEDQLAAAKLPPLPPGGQVPLKPAIKIETPAAGAVIKVGSTVQVSGTAGLQCVDPLGNGCCDGSINNTKSPDGVQLQLGGQQSPTVQITPQTDPYHVFDPYGKWSFSWTPTVVGNVVIKATLHWTSICVDRHTRRTHEQTDASPHVVTIEPLGTTRGFVQSFDVSLASGLAKVWIGPSPANVTLLLIARSARDTAEQASIKDDMVSALASAMVASREVRAIHGDNDPNMTELFIDPL